MLCIEYSNLRGQGGDVAKLACVFSKRKLDYLHNHCDQGKLICSSRKQAAAEAGCSVSRPVSGIGPQPSHM